MTPQNFAATANYFTKRARRAAAGPTRQRFENAAQLYRNKAEELGHRRESPETGASSGDIPSRRLRLMELFRTYADGEFIFDARLIPRETPSTLRLCTVARSRSRLLEKSEKCSLRSALNIFLRSVVEPLGFDNLLLDADSAG